MADAGQYEVRVDVTAKTDKLDAGMQQAAAGVEQASDQMTRDLDAVGSKFEETGDATGDLLGKIGKLAAGLFIAEGAMKMMTVAVSDNAEEQEQMMRSLPVIGPLVSAFLDLSKAMERNSDSMKDFRMNTVEADLALKSLNDTITIGNARLAAQEKMLAQSGQEQHDIFLQQYDERLAIIDAELALKIRAIDDEFNARATEVEAQALAYDEEYRILTQIRDEKYAAREAAREEAVFRKSTLSMQKQVAEAVDEERAEQERIEDIAKRQEVLNEAAEKHHEEMLDLEERFQKKKAERLAKEEEQRKAEMEFLKAKHSMEKEIAKARSEAEASVEGATSTFSTAGGSFTTQASASVNEAKILNKISEQSKDFLAKIVANTAAMVGGGFA